MGIKRNDLANFRPVCKDCNGVGTVPGDSLGVGRAQPCAECKGRGLER